MKMLLLGLLVSSALVYLAGHVNSINEYSPDVVAGKVYLEELAVNAPISNEELKIVSLLDRIENKIGILNEDEKSKFVKKVANYKDKFALVLNKVEAIPGMYGLNVRLLREVLAIPYEEVEELHIDNDPLEPKHRIEPVVDDESRLVDNMIIAERKAAYPGSLEFGLPDEVDEDVSEGIKDWYGEEPKTIDDLYDAITELYNLMLVQTIHILNSADEETSLPALPPFTPPQFVLPPPPTYPMHYPRSNRPYSSPPTYQSTDQFHSRSYQTQPTVNRGLLRPKAMQPFANNPAHVHNNLNYGKKKRMRRQAELGAKSQQQTYDQWYQNVYLPYLDEYMAEMAEYERDLDENEVKKAYSQHLFDKGRHVNLAGIYGGEYQEYQRNLCQPFAPAATGDPCYIGAIGANEGKCGKWNSTTSLCEYSDKKKRMRRQAEQGDQQGAQQQITYDQWYQTVYLPYLNQYMAEMAEYERDHHEKVKKAYSQHLFDQGRHVDLAGIYGGEYQEFQRQLCQPSAPTVTGDPCYISETGANEGKCGEWDAATSNCEYSDKKKRMRRKADQGDQQGAQQITYDQWYQTVYLPYLDQYMATMEEYERNLHENEVKKAYSQHLFDHGRHVDLAGIYGGGEYQEFQKLLCQPSAPAATGDPCYIAAIGANEGKCGKWDAATSKCA